MIVNNLNSFEFLNKFVGMGFRPLPPTDNVESTLIWYKTTHHENFKQWTDALDEFLAGTNELVALLSNKIITNIIYCKFCSF